MLVIHNVLNKGIAAIIDIIIAPKPLTVYRTIISLELGKDVKRVKNAEMVVVILLLRLVETRQSNKIAILFLKVYKQRE